MKEINGKTIVGKAEFMLKVDNLIDRYAPMSLDNLIETLEVEFNQASEDLLVFEKPLEFKKLVENRSRKLFTSAADTIYNSTAEFELLYTFDEFLEVCAMKGVKCLCVFLRFNGVSFLVACHKRTCSAVYIQICAYIVLVA